MVTFFRLSKYYLMIMGKASDIFLRKLVMVKFHQENHYTQHEITKKRKKLHALVCKIKRSLNSKCEYENCSLRKCRRKSLLAQFTARTESKLIQIAKANGRATMQE